MKKKLVLIPVLLMSAVLFVGCSTTNKIQSLTPSDISGIIHNKEFVFIANKMDPLRGMQKQLNSYYDLTVKGDTLNSFLPYYGRIYVPIIDPDKGPLSFISSNFIYNVKKKDKDWVITIVPKDHHYIQSLYFTVFDNGNATLNVTGLNRDPISFEGYLQKVG